MRKQNVIKRAAMIAMAGAMMAGSTIPAFAAGWQKNDTGWWYSTNEDNTEWYSDGWKWIDGNNDGMAECYYFDQNGYMLTDTTAALGYNAVNQDGAMAPFDKVLIQPVYVGNVNVIDPASIAGVVTDGKSWPQMTFDETLIKAMREVNGADLFPERTESAPGYPGQDMDGPAYAIQRNGKTITFGTNASNVAGGYKGPVSAFFDNFPEQGMELYAFFDNTGYGNPAWKGMGMPYVSASTGSSDTTFGLPQGSYRMAWGRVEINNKGANFQILLTEGEPGKYYIYPDSPMHVN